MSAGRDVCFLTSSSADPQSLSSQERNTYKEYNSQVSRFFYSSSQHVWRHAGLRFFLKLTICSSEKKNYSKTRRTQSQVQEICKWKTIVFLQSRVSPQRFCQTNLKMSLSPQDTEEEEDEDEDDDEQEKASSEADSSSEEEDDDEDDDDEEEEDDDVSCAKTCVEADYVPPI